MALSDDGVEVGDAFGDELLDESDDVEDGVEDDDEEEEDELGVDESELAAVFDDEPLRLSVL